MKKAIILAALLAACSAPPRNHDGMTCHWERSGRGVGSSLGTCFKDGRAFACSYDSDSEPQIVCATTCAAPAEMPK